MSEIQNTASVEADVLRCGYSVGYFDKADIEHWADRQIEATETPSPELIELCMLGQTHSFDVMQLLRSFGATAPATPISTQIGFIGLLLAKRKLTTEKAIRALWNLVYELGVTPEQRSEIYYLEDGYELAVQGTYGSLNEIEQKLTAFVAPYATLLAEAFPHLIPSSG